MIKRSLSERTSWQEVSVCPELDFRKSSYLVQNPVDKPTVSHHHGNPIRKDQLNLVVFCAVIALKGLIWRMYDEVEPSELTRWKIICVVPEIPQRSLRLDLNQISISRDLILQFDIRIVLCFSNPSGSLEVRSAENEIYKNLKVLPMQPRYRRFKPSC